ncbi:E3 ubiquitin-protein ligase DTX3L isoform X2 [Vidua chalybeata]|uniref:E3 ubiquitin-protein ligase DTX3L isoform X2 n=1 Tax=Vidua chalybeata TaxID=81927 RepID=UPI0023A8D1B6|nr:E3 ubiquitin-protein ligase DTX3L isoform X2 [Vidua chalybeata]
MRRLRADPQRSEPRAEREAKAKASGGAGSESESEWRGGIMAAAPLLVRVSPVPTAGDKAILKLQAYFQSGKRSGGGECNVRAGPKPGTYWVDFFKEQDRKSVESRTNHTLELGAKCLDIVILSGEGDPGKSRVTAQASASHSKVAASPSLPQQERWDNGGYGATAKEDLTKKIFLTVSATLNSSMFTEDQREKITIMCPNLKREGNPGMDGSEKLTGNFTDIEKAYHYFEDILASKDPNHDFSQSECKNSLKDENGLNTEEMVEFAVVTTLYEYFSHTRKEEIKELHKRFGARIRIKGHEEDNTLICISSDKSPALLQAASDSFIRSFQKATENLTEEIVPMKNSYTLEETIMKLNERFKNLLAKEEGNQLLLRGPGSEILAAQKFLAEEGENRQAEKNMKISSEWYKYRNGIEVDASVFKLLETILSKEIENINGKFDTLVEIKENPYGQKIIIFRPKSKTFDMSSHATESFISEFQSASAMLREKIISMKLSEDQKKTLNMLLNAKKFEDLNVKLKKTEDKLIIRGLPDHLYAAEEYIKSLLNTEGTQTRTRAPLSSDLSSQEATGASKKSSVRQKNNISSEGQTLAKTEEKDDDECPICRDTIENKEILERCKHAFCKICIDRAMTYKQACPVCNTVCGVLRGNQPEGTMSATTINFSLPGYPNCDTIVIEYDMNGGIQNSSHPNPGQRYGPAYRRAYLPDNEEGREILQLLKRAFNQKLIFTVGQSHTTGEQNVITWNDIHHKTAVVGGPTHSGAVLLQVQRCQPLCFGFEC